MCVPPNGGCSGCMTSRVAKHQEPGTQTGHPHRAPSGCGCPVWVAGELRTDMLAITSGAWFLVLSSQAPDNLKGAVSHPWSTIDYIELHCHSSFSLLDGASPPEALVARAGDLGMNALALTDHDAVYGVVPFITVARTHGIHPILGA